MTVVPLGNKNCKYKFAALIDDDDAERVLKLRWQPLVQGDRIYAVYNNTRGQRRMRLHRFIMQIHDESIHIDHRDHDGLNCQKHNLRVCTRSQNSANQIIKNVPKTSLFKGVSWHPPTGKWRARLCLGYKQVSLGLYATQEEAARAYDRNAVRYFGEFACTNKQMGLI